MRLLLLILVFLGTAESALARIKLITLPVRERVAVQLDHPQRALIEEQRVVPLVAGINQVDFSWGNAGIDPDSVLLRVIEPSAGTDTNTNISINVLSVSRPPGENALIWSVSASAAVAARFSLSYLLEGLNKRFHYRALTERDETELRLSQYLRFDNFASEDYTKASLWAGYGERISRPVNAGQTLELQLARVPGVAVRKLYATDPTTLGYYDPSKDQLNVPLFYVLDNSTTAGLGEVPLPPGKVRIFQRDGRGGSAFLGEDWGGYVPVDGELSLSLGLARDLVVKRKLVRSERSRIEGNVYRYDLALRFDIENFKDQPARLRLTERVGQIRDQAGRSSDRPPEWSLGDDHTLGDPDPEHSDFDTLVFETELPARASSGEALKRSHVLHLVLHNEW